MRKPLQLFAIAALTAATLHSGRADATPEKSVTVYTPPGVHMTISRIKINEFGALCAEVRVKNSSEGAVLRYLHTTLTFPLKGTSIHSSAAKIRTSAMLVLPGDSRVDTKCSYNSAQDFKKWTGKVVIQDPILTWITTPTQAMRYFATDLDSWSNRRPSRERQAEDTGILLKISSDSIRVICERGIKTLEAVNSPATPEIRELMKAASNIGKLDTWTELESEKTKILALIGSALSSMEGR